jgi:UDP-N-acetylglucosamine 2-epimerase (non-hydrolysing)
VSRPRARVTVIFGTRPEAIKLAPVVLALKRADRVSCRVCNTGQHREMLDGVLGAFGIRPDADLGLMRPKQSLAGLTARLVTSIDGELAEHPPNLVIVQGDTSTTLCGALAAFYRRIPVAHVEAGLRTGSLEAPWPEEANRVLTSRIASIHFAPTRANRTNLLREGIPADRVLVTGNTVIDALLLTLDRLRERRPEGLEWADPWLDGGPPRPLVLITSHRRESFRGGIEAVCQAIAILSARFPDVQFIYSVHRNPNVRQPVRTILGSKRRKNVHLIEPLPYLPFIYLMSQATVILTDSGGIQEEAPSLGKPVLVMREQTERPEAVEAGTAVLVGTRTEDICAEVGSFLGSGENRRNPARQGNPFGDGRAADRIIEGCLAFLGKSEGWT